MPSRQYVAILVAVFTCASASAADTGCKATKLDRFVLKGQDLYFGELHGTVESPALIRCLVTLALGRKGRPLIVSLEQESMRRDPASELWSGTDGRSSRAMWELTQFLLEQEKRGRLTFHQQLGGPILVGEGESPPVFDAADWEKRMGSPLRELAARGQLIALSGSMHSRKQRFEGLPYDLAGMFVGPDVLHIDLEPASSGTAWTCTSSGCGVHEIQGGAYGRAPGELIDGSPSGHDFIYLLPRLTASPPQLPAGK